MQSLRDTCKGFGDIKSFIEGPEFVLVGYGSVEEAILAKSHINSLWSNKASTEVVPEGKMELLWQQMNEPPKPTPSRLVDNSRPDNGRPGYFKWEDQSQSKTLSHSRQVSTPGGSVWSDGGFLSGISSPWSSDFSGTLTSPSTGYQSDDIASTTVTPDDRTQGHSVLSTFLPNGLLWHFFFLKISSDLEWTLKIDFFFFFFFRMSSISYSGSFLSISYKTRIASQVCYVICTLIFCSIYSIRLRSIYSATNVVTTNLYLSELYPVTIGTGPKRTVLMYVLFYLTSKPCVSSCY